MKRRSCLDQLPALFLRKFGDAEMQTMGFEKKDRFGRRTAPGKKNLHYEPDDVMIVIGHWLPAAKSMRG